MTSTYAAPPSRGHREGLLPFERLITPYAFIDINRPAHDATTGSASEPVLILADTDATDTNPRT